MAGATTHHAAGAAVATTPVTVEQAAAVLGVSASTVRRRIRDGSLRAEAAHRPQGAVWLVYLPLDATGGATQPPPAASVVATTPATAAGEQMVAYTRTLLEPLVAALERSQTRVAELERENGRLAAQLTAAAPAPQQAQEGPSASILGTETPEPHSEPSEPPSEPVPAPTPAPRPPEPNGHGLWPRVRAWLLS